MSETTAAGPFATELAELLGESVEHSQRFFPGERQLRPELWWRLWRRWRGGRRVDDALPSLTVAYLALTPTRVAVVESAFARGRGHFLTKPFAIWNRDQVSAQAERVEMERSSYDPRRGVSTRDHRVEAVRLMLATPDGPLWADLPGDDPLSTDLAHALGAATPPERG